MSLEEELTQLNIGIGEAERQQNINTLGQILADDLIFRRASGIVIDKATYLEDLKNPENTYNYLCSEVIDIKLSESQDTAIVTLHVRAKGKRNSNPFEGVYRNIRFLRKEGQDWKCYAWFNELLPPSEEEERKHRDYDTSPLPVVPDTIQEPAHKEILLSLYSEICNSWRMLTDVRFKLLGLVPTVSAAVLISLLSRSKPDEGLSPFSRIVISIFGLLITLGISIYEQRNSELYDDLINRARRIEQELGIDTGQFLGRIKLSKPWINHKNAIKLIYVTAVLGWLAALIMAICEISSRIF